MTATVTSWSSLSARAPLTLRNCRWKAGTLAGAVEAVLNCWRHRAYPRSIYAACDEYRRRTGHRLTYSKIMIWVERLLNDGSPQRPIICTAPLLDVNERHIGAGAMSRHFARFNRPAETRCPSGRPHQCIIFHGYLSHAFRIEIPSRSNRDSIEKLPTRPITNITIKRAVTLIRQKQSKLSRGLLTALSSCLKGQCLAILLIMLMAPIPANAETLGEALAGAYQNNPGVEASRASSRAARERVLQAKAQFGPSLTADAGYSFGWRRVTENGATMLRQEGFTRQISLSLDQPLFTFGRLSAQRRIADAGYGASIADVHAAEQELMANVIIAYAGVLRDQKLVDIARENLSQLTSQLDQIEARYSARYATETDLQQTLNRIFSGQAQLDLAQGALLASRNNYRSLVGHYPAILAPLPQLPPLPRTISEAQIIARNANPVLEAARSDLGAAQARIAQTRGNARPYVGIQGSLVRSPLTIENDRTQDLTTQIQLGITVPIYSAGLLSARIREATQLADAASQQIEQTSRNLREDIASYWDQLSAARRALPAYTRAISAAQSAFNGAQQQQLAGHITALDVLDTARDLLNTRQAQAQAEAQLYVQHALLLGAMGQLRVDAFSPDTPVFDAKSYEGASWVGLPTGPVVEAVDRPAIDGRFIPSPVAVEHDSEPGHLMAPEPGEQ